ncbi:MAG: hypothetical protein COB04_12390 [Gammaproteobacteria bacterium]|nr:MAG: hypothetical protein COB04_12390 [Gammaproteobacteria bacterium]
MAAFSDLFIFIILLGLGYGFGQWAERRHYRSIHTREKELAGILVFAERLPPPDPKFKHSSLVGGSVVISIDYFKRFVSLLRSFIGGRVSSYESLLDRARREALLRMKADAQAKGFQNIFNVKFETASISKGKGKQIGSIEVYVYGTALGPGN